MTFFRSYPATPLQDIFIAAGPDLIELMEKMLALDPNRRVTAKQALMMPYFANKPYPSHGSKLPLPSSVKEASGENAASRPAGTKRKRDGVTDSGLAKRLVF